MEVHFTTTEGITLITVQGRIDTITAGDFEAKVTQLTDGSGNIIIDCAQMDYISSSGLRVFLVLQKRIKAMGGVLKLCSLQPSIKEIFDISGFSTIFSIYTDQASAIS